MGRQNIFSAISVASVVPPASREDLLQFLINNRQHILRPSEKSDAFNVRFSANTLVSEIVHRIANSGKDTAFNLINLPSKTTSLREVVDMTFIPFDILQLKDVTPTFSKSLSLISELDDKMIINITDIVRNNGNFSDLTQFHWRVVRDFLSRSFYVSPGNSWLTPAVVRYVAKVYSMTMASRISQAFNLTRETTDLVQCVFCLFYVAAMTRAQDAASFVKSSQKQLGIPHSADLHQVTSFVEDILHKSVPESLEEVFAVIDAFGSDGLTGSSGSRLNRPTLMGRFQNLYSESHVSSISLEYPPYFLYMIILALSGSKVGLSYYLKSLNLDKEGREVMGQAIKSPLFMYGI